MEKHKEIRPTSTLLTEHEVMIYCGLLLSLNARPTSTLLTEHEVMIIMDYSCLSMLGLQVLC